jgi:hypothetical protein
MNHLSFQNSLNTLQEICSLPPDQFSKSSSKIKTHILYLIEEIESLIKQQEFEEAHHFLDFVLNVDSRLNLTNVFKDVKYSYFLNINLAFIIQQYFN